MTAGERSIIQKLDAVVRSNGAEIRPIVARVREDLAAKKAAVMTWEPIPLTLFREALPTGIKSAWVFVLRAGANTGAERHPNSHQRMMSWEGSGDMQISDTKEPLKWQSNLLVSDPTAPIEQRWISIPQNVWHQPVIGKDADWAVVSFHTVPAEELIEERPDAGDKTRQMIYLKKQ